MSVTAMMIKGGGAQNDLLCMAVQQMTLNTGTRQSDFRMTLK